MTFTKGILKSAVLIGLLSAPAAAQDRPFLFSISTTETDERHVVMHYDAGFGERAFDVVQGDRPEQRIGIQASLGNGLIALGRVGFAVDERDTRSTQQAELLYNTLHARSRTTTLAVGMGMRHESAGINVVTGRIAAGRRFDAWRMDGNVLFEKPFSAQRDALDLITTFGIARRVSSALHLGIEAIAEDLEGFWEPQESEGGARLLVGPSIRIAPHGRLWQLSVAGGPMIHATRSDRAGDAVRALPASTGRDGYAVRASLSYLF